MSESLRISTDELVDLFNKIPVNPCQVCVGGLMLDLKTGQRISQIIEALANHNLEVVVRCDDCQVNPSNPNIESSYPICDDCANDRAE